MSRETIPLPQTGGPEQSGLPFWFPTEPKSGIPTRESELIALIRSAWDYEQARQEYGREAWMDLRSEKSREDFFRRIRTPKYLDAFIKETKTNNHNLFKLFQKAAIGQAISARLEIGASAVGPGHADKSAVFPMLLAEHRKRGQIGRLSGYVGEAIAGQLIRRSKWEARYPTPALDALLGFDRVAYHPATHSWRIIQCKSDNRLTVPFAVAGQSDFGQLERVLSRHFEEKPESAEQPATPRRPSPEETIRDFKVPLKDIATTCAILEKQYPGNTIMPMLIMTAGIGSKAYTESTDPSTGLLRDDFRGMIDFDTNREIS